MWWLLLVAGVIVVVLLLIARRVRRYQRDIGDVFDGEYRDPPLFHDRAGPH